MIALLLDAAMKIFGIHAATILGPSRASEVVDARWAVMFVLAERHNWPPTRIARALGVHHSSVLYALKSIYERMAQDKIYAHQVRQLMQSQRTSGTPSVTTEPTEGATVDIQLFVVEPWGVPYVVTA